MRRRTGLLTLAAAGVLYSTTAMAAPQNYAFVTAPDNSGAGWYNAGPGADTRSGGTATIASGPAGASALGSGSLRMTSDSAIGGSGQAKAQFMNYGYTGLKLSDITGLSYQDYRFSSSTTAPAQRISINIAVDFTGSGSFTTLVFEPIYQSGGIGALLSDTWQTWDAFKSGNAIWWSTQNIPGVCAFNCFVSWNTILANNPNAKVTLTGPIGFNIGSGWTGVFSGAADGLRIRTAARTDIYDFEVSAPAPTNNAFAVTPSSVGVFDANNVNGVVGDFAPGFAGGSFESNGVAKTDMYFTPEVLFGRPVAAGEVKTMTYWTKTGFTHAADLRDWSLIVYTKPYAGQVGTSFYGTRNGTEPYFSENIADPANTWNQWTTDGANNWLRIYESTYNYFGSYTDPHLASYISGMSLGGTRGPGVPYATQTILFFSVQTGSATAANFFGQVDGLRIELINGSVATINFEANDAVPPTVSGQATPAPNANGWNNTPVNVTFACTDNPGGSGVSAASNVGGNTTLNEGANQSVTSTGTCVDNVGNVASPATATVSNIDVDLTKPVFAACTAQSFLFGTGTYPVSIIANDLLSGLDAGASTLSGSVNTSVLGTASVLFTAVDLAGNSDSVSCNYSVVSANNVKTSVLASLQALLPTLTKPNSDKVKSAIDHLNKSLNPKFWVDGSHLTKDGKPVFDEEKKAVHSLEEVVPQSLVIGAINSLVADDRSLATIAIAESTKSAADIAKANAELAKGDADAAAGKYEEAVGHYKTAWDLAT